MILRLLTEHHLKILSLKGDFTGSSESTLVKMPHCWKSHVAAHLLMNAHHLLHVWWCTGKNNTFHTLLYVDHCKNKNAPYSLHRLGSDMINTHYHTCNSNLIWRTVSR